MRVLSGLVREPRFENAALQTERFVVFGEFQRRLSDPQFLLSREVDKLLWGSAFPRKNTIGEEMSLLGVTPQRLEQILKNLLSNACKFTDAGNVKLQVSLDTNVQRFRNPVLRQAPSAISFAVSDTGIGIPRGKQ